VIVRLVIGSPKLELINPPPTGGPVLVAGIPPLEVVPLVLVASTVITLELRRGSTNVSVV
jgi:hypothetical protein